MKIAVFAYEFPALSETFVINQITGLIDRGHDVTIFAERPRDDRVVHRQVERYELTRRTRYLRLPGNRFVRATMVPIHLLRQPVRRWRPLLNALNVLRYGREAASLRLFYWALRMIDCEDFDVIHCHFGPVGQLAVQLRETGAIAGRISTVFHGVDVSAALRDSPDIYRHLFRHGDLFMPISENWKRKVLTLGCDPNRTIVHHMGVEVDGPLHTESGHEPGAIPTVLTVGRMVEKKGLEFGLRAIARLAERNMAVQYVIVGDGVLRHDLESLCRELGISGNVTFLGWQPGEVVRDLMRDSDLLLAPSVTDASGDQEGIPVTLMEAMIAGLPVVSTRHSGIPELVEEGVSGILVDEKDIDGLAEAIVRLVHDDRLRYEMIRAAHRRIRTAFDIDELNDRLERQFIELVRTGRPAREAVMHASDHRPCQDSSVPA